MDIVMAGSTFGGERSRLTQSSVVALFVVAVSWFFCTVAQVEKYVCVRRGLQLMCVGAGCVVLLMLFVRRLYLQHKDVPRWSIWAVLALVFLAFAVLYPKSLHPLPGKGSDREDALRVELHAVTHHQYPYDARTFLDHAPTPLPGAMWLAAPFYATSKIAFQNLVWAVLFGSFLLCFFARRGTATVFALLFLLTGLENLNDFVVGGDFVTNVLYLSIAIALFAKATEPSTPWLRTVASVCLLALALSSRAVYAVTMIPLIAYGVRNGVAKRTLLMLSGVMVVAACITLPVFWPQPVERLSIQLSQNADKLQFLPAFMPRLLTALAFGVASLGFLRRRLRLHEVYGLCGAAVLLLTFPPMASIVHHEGGWLNPLTSDLEYLAPAAMFLSLWGLAVWERQSVALDTVTE
jgi:hypothetical protein